MECKMLQVLQQFEAHTVPLVSHFTFAPAFYTHFCNLEDSGSMLVIRKLLGTAVQFP